MNTTRRCVITLLLLLGLPILAHAQSGIPARFFYELPCTGAMYVPRWHPLPGTTIYIWETRTFAYGAQGSGLLWGGQGSVERPDATTTWSLAFSSMTPPIPITFAKPRRLDGADSLFFEFWCPAGLGTWYVSVDLTYTLTPGL